VAALVDKAINNGAYMCLYKPLDMDEIIAVIDKICRHKRNGTLIKDL
jgi:DNA-binding response OmpR family regulator